jgi:hypothetical protein
MTDDMSSALKSKKKKKKTIDRHVGLLEVGAPGTQTHAYLDIFFFGFFQKSYYTQLKGQTEVKLRTTPSQEGQTGFTK